MESRLIYYRLEIDDAVKVIANVLQKSAILKVARSSCHCSFTGLWTQREGSEQSNGISREKKKREIATVIRKLGFGAEAERKRREWERDCWSHNAKWRRERTEGAVLEWWSWGTRCRQNEFPLSTGAWT